MRALARHDGRRSAGFEGARDMIVAVMRIALDGDEQVAGLKRAGVDGDAARGTLKRGARRPQRLGQFRSAP